MSNIKIQTDGKLSPNHVDRASVKEYELYTQHLLKLVAEEEERKEASEGWREVGRPSSSFP